MFVRTSDRGEPAKISFCSLRTDSVENSPDPRCGRAPTDETSGLDCVALSINGLPCGIGLGYSILGFNTKGARTASARPGLSCVFEFGVTVTQPLRALRQLRFPVEQSQARGDHLFDRLHCGRKNFVGNNFCFVLFQAAL